MECRILARVTMCKQGDGMKSRSMRYIGLRLDPEKKEDKAFAKKCAKLQDVAGFVTASGMIRFLINKEADRRGVK